MWLLHLDNQKESPPALRTGERVLVSSTTASTSGGLRILDLGPLVDVQIWPLCRFTNHMYEGILIHIMVKNSQVFKFELTHHKAIESTVQTTLLQFLRAHLSSFYYIYVLID